MPKIPTILANDASGFTPQSATAQALPTGLDSLSQGLMQASGAVGQLAENRLTIEKKRKDVEEAKWEGDNLYTEMKHLTEWQANPQNSNDPNYAENFKNYAESRIKEYTAAAPSKEAKRNIENRLRSFTLGRYSEALGVTERTRQEQSKDSIVSQTAFALGMTRESQGVPGVDVLGESETARADIHKSIDRMFTTPTLAGKFHAYVDSEFAVGLATADAEVAKSIVTNSTSIEEGDKPALLSKIESLNRSQNSINLANLTKVRMDHMATVEAGNSKEKLPISFYSQFPNPTQEKKEDDLRIDAYVSARENTTRIGPMNGAAASAELEKLRKGIKSTEDKASVAITHNQILEASKAREDDRVTWLNTYNPEVIAASRGLDTSVPGSEGYLETRRNINQTVLKYQGYPAPGAENPEYYLNRASGDRSLMTQGEAQSNADYINSASPKEVLERIQSVMQSYPDPEHQFIAFNDMVKLGRAGIKEEYQALWQNKDQPFAQTLTEALTGASSLAKLNTDVRKDLSKAIDGNSTWKFYEQALGGARADEALGFKKAIEAMSNKYITDGDKPEIAAKKAINQVMNATMGVTSANGRPLVVSRTREEGKPPRTDAEIKRIGNDLHVALRDVDIRVIDQTNFTQLLGRVSDKETDIARLQLLRDSVTKTGIWKTTNDGQGATLFVTGDNGNPFEVHDREGRAFRVNFDDLPHFISVVGRDTPFAVAPGEKVEVNQIWGDNPFSPAKTYPLQEYKWPDHALTAKGAAARFDALLGIYQKKTYWPSNTYMKMTQPGK